MTTFYDQHKLKAMKVAPLGTSTSDKILNYSGVLLPFPEETTLKKIANDYMGVPCEIISQDIKVNLSTDEQYAVIKLGINISYTTKEVNYRNYLQLAVINLHTVYYNCSALHIAGLSSDYGHGIGAHLLQQVINYAEAAGYSFIICNTAGEDQNPLVESFFIEKFGFEPMKDFCYINKRSGNANIWLVKYLSEVQRISYNEALTPEEEDEDDYRDNNEDWDD